MDKKLKEILENFYDENNRVSEEGIEYLTSQYKMAAELEVKLINLTNEYVKELDKEVFGFIWNRITNSIVLHHNINQIMGNKPDGVEVE